MANRFFNTISFKIALVVSMLVVVLMVVLNFVVVNRGERVFSDVYTVIRDKGGAFSIDEPIYFPGGYSAPFNEPLRGAVVSPRDQFKHRFQYSLFLIGAGAFVGAVGIGLLASWIVARPLNTLQSGLKKLRQSNYKLRLQDDHSNEFAAIMSEFNSLASDLQRTEELRKNLISDTSHELKTPITVLAAQLEGIDDGVLTLDKERIGMLRQQVQRLQDMTEGLQEYARLRSQALSPHVTNFRLAKLIEKITLQFEPRLNEKKIVVTTDISDEYTVSADESLVERIFVNLFDNTLRYADARAVHISTHADEIIFSDDGVGIPQMHQHDIFERFFRLEKSRNRSTGGLGLGLAIVKEIVEVHGWKIHARTPENQKGVEFVIKL
ncbi:MAG: HAMP domain-containing sensor histidine kinase [Patescibacteria group bacterium]|jgi:signal transduction histidine kinase